MSASTLDPRVATPAARVLSKVFRNYASPIELALWDGTRLRFGSGAPRLTLTFRDPRALRDLVLFRDPLRMARDFFRGRLEHLAQHLPAASNRARQIVAATQFLHQQPCQHHRGQRERDRYYDHDVLFPAPAGQYFFLAQTDLHHQRHVGYLAGVVNARHAVHGADAARSAGTVVREQVFQGQVPAGRNAQPGGGSRHAGDQFAVLVHQRNYAVASDLDVPVGRLQRLWVKGLHDGAGETAVGIVGQLAEFLREQSVHASAERVSQRRHPRPRLAQAAQSRVRRLQHQRGALLH